MNILHGDSAAGSFKAAFNLNNNELLVFRDVLSCGPSKEFSDIKTWQNQRLAFWNNVCCSNGEETQSIENMPRDFYSNFSTFESAAECKLWIGTGLSDQLLMAFIVHLFDKLNIDFSKLSIFQYEKFKNYTGKNHPIQGLGLLEPGQIKKHPEPHKLDKNQIRYAKSAWEAFVAPSPEQYIKFMAGSSDTMPLLHFAMSYLYYRYPKINNGLSYSDETLLKHTSVHAPKATKVIGYTLADDLKGLDLVGDWYLFSRLKNLANIKQNTPLIQINPEDSPMRETTVEITEFGKLALENKVNVYQENGLNDWVGGVHLKSNNIWVRDNKCLICLKNNQT